MEIKPEDREHIAECYPILLECGDSYQIVHVKNEADYDWQVWYLPNDEFVEEYQHYWEAVSGAASHARYLRACEMYPWLRLPDEEPATPTDFDGEF